MANGRIGVGLVGVSPDKGFASIAHVPALRVLPDFELAAVCTTRLATAAAAAAHVGARGAYADPQDLANDPNVDLVTICVKAPDHFEPAMAALAASKHVYCEWPLGRNTEQAALMRHAAARSGVRHAVGLQGRMSPAIRYVKDLVAEGYVGRVLAATQVGCAPNWGETIDRAYQVDLENGANLMTITGGHQIDALCHVLGPFRELSAFVVSQRDHIFADDVGAPVPKTAPDQLAVQGLTGDDATVSFQIRGGMRRGTAFLLEIHGVAGDIVVSATTRDSMQRQDLRVQGARGAGGPLEDLPVPAHYTWVPAETPRGSPLNVAQLYAKLGASLRGAPVDYPTFDDALATHRLLDTIMLASATGERQKL